MVRIQSWLAFCVCLTHFCRMGQAEWEVVSTEELPQILALAESALETQWNATGRGRCRAIVHNAFLTDGTKGPVELEFCWDKTRVGLMVYNYTIPLTVPPKVESTPEVIACFGPTEEWWCRTNAGWMSGKSAGANSGLRYDYDLRPHTFWLSRLSSSFSHLHVLRTKMKPNGVVVSRAEDGRVRIDSRLSRMEFDPRFGFGIVLKEVYLKQDQLLAKEKQMRPTRNRYELGSDAHGVWYCKSMEYSQWPVGGEGDPTVYPMVTVLEYDSNPPPEQMHLDYKSLPIPPGTTVQSSVRGKAGQWVYGKEKEGQAGLDGAKFRNLGNQMRTRGFSRSERGTAP